MALKRKRAVLWIIAAVAAMVILVGLTVVFLPAHRGRGRVERCLADFHANPCQKTADTLILMLAKGKVTQEQGNKILKALLQPRVIVEESYVTGQPLIIRVEPKNPVKLQIIRGIYDNSLYIEGVTSQEGCSDSESLIIAPSLSDDLEPLGTMSGVCAVFPAVRIQKPGTYKGQVRLSYSLSNELNLLLKSIPSDFFFREKPSIMERILEKLRSKELQENVRLMTFQCSYEISFQIRVVAPSSETKPAGSGG